MLMKCSECGGKVSDKASACPHCGAPVEFSGGKTRRGDEEDAYVPPPKKGFDFVALFLSFMKFCFFLLTVIIIVGAVCFFVFRYDIGGAASKLRKIAESDAGDGSHIDKSNSRVMFKYHLSSFLDAVQGRESNAEKKETKPEPGSSIENARQLPDAEPDKEKKTPENLPSDKVERKPLELPPPPPEEAVVKQPLPEAE